MLLFGPKNDVVSKKKGLLRNFNGFSVPPPTPKKKVFSEIATVFPAEIKLFACNFDGPFISQCHLDSWAPGSLSPLPPPPPLVGPVLKRIFRGRNNVQTRVRVKHRLCDLSVVINDAFTLSAMLPTNNIA